MFVLLRSQGLISPEDVGGFVCVYTGSPGWGFSYPYLLGRSSPAPDAGARESASLWDRRQGVCLGFIPSHLDWDLSIFSDQCLCSDQTLSHCQPAPKNKTRSSLAFGDTRTATECHHGLLNDHFFLTLNWSWTVSRLLHWSMSLVRTKRDQHSSPFLAFELQNQYFLQKPKNKIILTHRAE